MAAFVKPGQKVLLKPNMLSGKSPERAVTTHPEIVRAVIRQVQAAGGVVSLGDSPGIGTPENVARKCGIQQVVEETGIRFAPFSESVRLPTRTGTFHELEVARDILDADVIINLPKLKTHQMMGLTCAVKNMFGAVVGLRKPRLHLQAGTDKAFFALLLLELCEALSPALTIVDAVVGMEGEGPGSGDPVEIGALLAGSHPQAVDTVATELVGMKPRQVWTQQKAIDTQRPLTTLADLKLLGTPLDELRLKGFRPARMTDVNFGLKGGLKRALKNSLTARPVVRWEVCRLCNDCVTHCPPEAMKIENGRLEIDYERCIRCFCCQELCPHAALATKQGLLLNLHSFLTGKK
ncbi:MAG: (4Fe-4S)-binding protein [Desulfuromonas sp.]|nr:MAG: (4Fe-4S)-binding protein [Desulfuromonas sp.]